jgi:hypothetical protein
MVYTTLYGGVTYPMEMLESPVKLPKKAGQLPRDGLCHDN